MSDGVPDISSVTSDLAAESTVTSLYRCVVPRRACNRLAAQYAAASW